jgi:hypothetical protein
VVTHQRAPRDVLELPLKWNQRLHVLEAQGEWWYIARTMDGKEGWVSLTPSTSCSKHSSLHLRL